MEIAVAGAPVFAATGGRAFDPGRPALVFVHGAGMDHSVWQQQSRYFAHHGYGVLAVDLPGHGRSGGAPLPDVGAMADWLAMLLPAAGLDCAVLIGHSLGAAAALEAAARHPARVRALALLGIAEGMPVHPDLLAAAGADLSRAAGMIAGWGHGAEAHRGGNRVPGNWLVGGAVRLIEASAPGVLAADLAAAGAWTGGAAAGRIACPTLLLLGSEDRMTPVRKAAPLADAISDCRRVVLPRTGHMMMVEAPVETLGALKRFLGEAS